MLDDFEKENQDDDNEVLFIKKQYEFDSDEPAYIQEIDDSFIISFMNLVVAKADSVATFDGNNLIYSDPMKSAKTKRIECLEMMQDKLYYYT